MWDHEPTRKLGEPALENPLRHEHQDLGRWRRVDALCRPGTHATRPHGGTGRATGFHDPHACPKRGTARTSDGIPLRRRCCVLPPHPSGVPSPASGDRLPQYGSRAPGGRIRSATRRSSGRSPASRQRVPAEAGTALPIQLSADRHRDDRQLRSHRRRSLSRDFVDSRRARSCTSQRS